MSSKGTPRTTVRIDGGLMEDIEIAIDRRNTWSREEGWTVSDFLRVAALEKLAKMRRSRAPRRKRPKPENPIA